MNQRHLSTSRSFVAMLGALSAMAPLSIDASLPALPAMARELQAPTWEMQATLGGFMLAFGLGQLYFGPLSDRHGRRPVAIAGLAIYAIAGLACALAPNALVLVLARILQGFGACGSVIVSRAMIRDIVSDRGRAASLQSYVGAVSSIAPIVAPLLGAAILPLGWRAIYAALALAGIGLLLLAVFGLPETLAQPRSSNPLQVYKEFFHIPRTTALGFVIFACFGAYFSFISGSPFVLQHELGVPYGWFSVAFAINACCLIAGSITGGRLAARRDPEKVLAGGALGLCAAGVLAFVLGFHPSVATFIISMSLFAFAEGIVLPNAYATGLNDAGAIAGTASAALGAGQQFGGAIGSTVVGMLPYRPGLNVGICAIAGGIVTFGAYVASCARRSPSG